MQNNAKDLERKYEPLPILKPLLLAPEFISKIKGENKLKTNVMMLIAEDGDNLFFVSCLFEKEKDENHPYVLNIDEENGILDNGGKKFIAYAKAIDLSVIYKINYYELISKIQNDRNDIETLPYLSIKDQLNVVEAITKKLKDKINAPKLILIKKKQKKDQITA